VAVVVVAMVVASGGCVPTGERPVLTDEHVDDVAPAASRACPPSDGAFERFGVAVVRIDRPEGAVDRCVLVADTVELRARGLMEVPDLGGYDGMLFAFAEDSTGGFWMANTVMPLSIAFIDAGGQVVAAFDMDPCPESADCPSYEPDAAYRWAVEVPQQGLAAFGLTPGASLDVSTLPGAIE
jgi:uncharacterized membrane protein (UPF0127 family)